MKNYPIRYEREFAEYDVDNQRYKGFARLLWLNTFSYFTAQNKFSNPDKLMFNFLKKAVSPTATLREKKVLRDYKLFRFLNALPEDKKKELYYLKDKKKARNEMHETNKELVAAANLIEGRGTQEDIDTLQNSKNKDKYGITLQEMRNIAMTENIIGFSDMIKNLVKISKNAEKDADKVSATKVIMSAMGWDEQQKSGGGGEINNGMIPEFSGMTEETLFAAIDKIDGKQNNE